MNPVLVASLAVNLRLKTAEARVIGGLYEAAGEFVHWRQLLAGDHAASINSLHVLVCRTRAKVGADFLESRGPGGKSTGGYRLLPFGMARCRHAIRAAAHDLSLACGVIAVPRDLDPTLADLWVDGRVYRVDPEIVAHAKFLSDNLAHMATQAAKYAARVRELEGRRAA